MCAYRNTIHPADVIIIYNGQPNVKQHTHAITALELQLNCPHLKHGMMSYSTFIARFKRDAPPALAAPRPFLFINLTIRGVKCLRAHAAPEGQ